MQYDKIYSINNSFLSCEIRTYIASVAVHVHVCNKSDDGSHTHLKGRIIRRFFSEFPLIIF